MRILRPTIALVLGLSLAPALFTVASAQNVNNSVPPPNPAASLSVPPAGSSGGGANNSVPTGGAQLTKKPHVKTHKRKHKNAYGKHYNMSSRSKGR